MNTTRLRFGLADPGQTVIAVAERIEVHPALDDWADQQHPHRRADRDPAEHLINFQQLGLAHLPAMAAGRFADLAGHEVADRGHIEPRSEEHTSELQSLIRISSAVFCLKKKKLPKI